MSEEMKKDESIETSESEVKEETPAVEAADAPKPAAPAQAAAETSEPAAPAAPAPGGGRHGDSPSSEEHRRPMAPRVPRFKRKGCRFCQNKNLVVDYKSVDVLERFITDRGKILPRRITGTCAKHQRSVALAIKRARTIALLPFIVQ